MKAKNLHEWREKVLEREGYKCRECGRKSHVIAHHIKSQYTYPKLKLEIDNGKALCRRCHALLKEFALTLKPANYQRYTRGKIELERLSWEIKHLHRSQVLYRVLKRELSLMGYWKNRQRGDPAKGYRERGRKDA